jgi:putative hydrolase of the HAD superfamily
MKLLDVDKVTADKMRAEYWKKYGTSLAGLMRNYNIDPDDFLNTVHDIDFSVLPKDINLLEALNNLPGRKLIYTNGTASYAREVLKYRGLLDVFNEIYGIEHAAYVPKPFPKAFEIIFSKASVVHNRSAMFEDEVRNLEVPYKLGLKTILVSDVQSNKKYVEYATNCLPDFLRQIN